jgi:succinate-semialdehyde dehydrogenase/glutarate-semialdehyde dehydrogenase
VTARLAARPPRPTSGEFKASIVMSPEPKTAKNLIDGEWAEGGAPFPIVDKYSGAPIGQGWAATEAMVDAAVAAARRSFVEHPLNPAERYTILMKVAELLARDREALAGSIIGESGIPWKDAYNEVGRAMETFRVSAEEGKRLQGEMVPIDGAPDQANRMAYTIRVPRGVVGAITSFNSPLNMVAHKVAPAIASGNTVVFKPPQATPLSATRLFELLLEAGLPPGHANLVHGAGSTVGQQLIEHPGLDFFSFTGSTGVGKKIREARLMGHVALELGSISATVVCADADLAKAAARCAASGFRRMGQMCTSTQRLFVERSALDAFLPLLTAAAKALKVGDPWAKDTDVGPMISDKEAARAEAWVAEAVTQGARLLLGGKRDGAVLPPTILTDVTPAMKVMCDEIFAPVLSVIPFDSFDEAVEAVNSVPYGLAAGLFTSNINRAIEGSRRLHVGVVHINEPSSSRVDLMPFGGVKDSGVGVEGPRYAMREMTEERLVTITL